MTISQEQAGYALWRGLDDCHSLNSDTTLLTVTHWLEYRGAGFPDVPLMHERAREDAKLWAASAQQHELEAYLAAAVMALESSSITKGAAKRLAAMGYKNMDPETRVKFKEWVEKQ